MYTLSDLKPYAVMLGGRAKGCNIELHDVVFVAAQDIHKSYEKLRKMWFGDPQNVHMDAFICLDEVEGYKISLKPERYRGNKRLFFVNLGGYLPGIFQEYHQVIFVVAENTSEAKIKALEEGLKDHVQVHKDDLLDVDDCIMIDEVEGFYLHLLPSDDATTRQAENGYFPF